MTGELTDEELRARIAKLREANRLYDEGEISWERRVALHNEACPGIGDLGGQSGRRRENDGRGR